jgi:hypothetical protein
MAYECSIDAKCSKFIQDRLCLLTDNEEKKRFFDKILKNMTD